MAIEGNDEVSDREILSRLALEAESGAGWSDDLYLEESLYERDVPRIPRIYRALGYYEATVDGVDLSWTPDGRGVSLTFRVTEGPATRVASVDIVGIESLSYRAAREVREAILLEEGDVLTEEAWDETLAGIRRVLRRHGYPRPDVRGRVGVDSVARRAVAEIRVETGPVARFGRVTIGGLDTIPEPPIRGEIDVVPGALYDASEIELARRSLVSLGVFSSVTIEESIVQGGGAAEASPDAPAAGVGDEATAPAAAGPPAGPTDRADLHFALDEGSMQRLRAGFGFSTEQGRQAAELSAIWEHRNLWGGLRHLRWANRLGWAFNLADLVDLGPFGTTALSFRQPNRSDLRLAFLSSLKYEALPISNEYSTHAIQARVGAERRSRDGVYAFGLHNGVRWVDLWNIREGAVVVDRPYLLGLIDATFTLDLRDDPVEPSSGHFLSLLARVGLDPTGGEYDGDVARDQYRYALLRPDLRGYYRLHERLVLALRVTASFAFPIGSDALVPPDERVFAGGANSVRGYPFHAIGTWRTCEDAGATCTPPPAPGGNVSWLFSAELRIDIVGDLSAAIFFDAGNVIDGAFTTVYDASGSVFHPSVGAGVRYRTAVGPVRLDIGVPLQADPRIGDVPVVAFQLTFGEAF
jgi:translocation and assembly module TamA